MERALTGMYLCITSAENCLSVYGVHVHMCAHMQGNPSKARDLSFVLFEFIILCVDLQQYENWLSWKEQGAQDTQFSCVPGPCLSPEQGSPWSSSLPASVPAPLSPGVALQPKLQPFLH